LGAYIHKRMYYNVENSAENNHKGQTLTMFSDPFSVSLKIRLPFGLDKLIRF
jgi:hypothetical protein